LRSASTDALQWANHGMDRLLHHAPRLNAPLIDSVRDPDFLAAIQKAAREQVVTSARSNTIAVGRTFDVTAAPMPGGGAVAVLRDLTDAERMEKTRRDFIANVSHELRTPLTSIQGYTETLLDSPIADNHVREFLEIIRKNSARMSRLTEDLLTLAAWNRANTGSTCSVSAPKNCCGCAGELPRSGAAVWSRVGDGELGAGWTREGGSGSHPSDFFEPD